MNRFRWKVLMLCIVVVLFEGRPSCISAAADQDESLRPEETSSSNIMKIIRSSSYNVGNASGRKIGESGVAAGGATTKRDARTNSSEDPIETFIPYDLGIVESAVTKLNDSQCLDDSMKVLDAIGQRERWALEMFDASSKFPVGLLQGALYQLGNFDECLAVRQPTRNFNPRPIQGQYCLVDVEVRLPNHGDRFRAIRTPETANKKRSRSTAFNDTIHWGICVPSSCTVNEAETFFKEVFAEYNGINVQVTNGKCHVNKSEPFTVLEIVYGVVLGLFLLLVVLSTIVHYHHIHVRKKTPIYTLESARSSQPGTVKQMIFCFSVIQTVGKLLRTKPMDLNLECISGIKVLSMFFIISGHTLMHTVGGPIQNGKFFDEHITDPGNAIFANSPLLVDTFLLISGFLVCYLLIIEYRKRDGRVNVLFLFIARYIRLTPSYLMVVLFYCTYFIRMGSGPLWDSRIGIERDRCLKYWWTNILYINNYVNPEQLCMFQSWYLAVDYHHFILALFIVYPLWRWRRVGRALLGCLIFISMMVPFWLTFVNKLDATFFAFPPEIFDVAKSFYFSTVYVKSHMRTTSYLFGVLFGYLVYRLKDSGTKIPSYVLWFGWFFSLVCGLLSMGPISIFMDPDHEYNALESAIYACLHRASWSLAIGWVLVACITDNAALVNKFLSWKFFVPLGRLTYCAYLGNGIVELYSLGATRENMVMTKFLLGSKLLAHLVLTFLLAFIICIMFESPIHGLEKIIFRKGKNKNTHNNTNEATGEGS